MRLQTWSESELAANRRGELAARQVARIRRQWHVILAAAALPMMPLCGLGAYVYAEHERQLAAMAPACAALAVVGVVAGVYLINRRLEAMVRGFGDRRVVAITGRLEIKSVARRKYCTLDGRVVRPLRGSLDRLADQVVTAYLLSDSNWIVAIEP